MDSSGPEAHAWLMPMNKRIARKLVGKTFIRGK